MATRRPRGLGGLAAVQAPSGRHDVTADDSITLPTDVSTPLVYIGGSGRSGSTLLERMLASMPGYWSVGELVFIWQRSLIRNDRCGCGSRFRDCAFWTQVGEAAFGGWSQVDVEAAASLRATVDRHRNLDRIAGLRGGGKLTGPLAEYAELTGRLYQAVREVTGASVIVDSSKSVSYALLVRNLPGVDLRLVHLVRRSHGVAYSWSRRVRKPDVGDGNAFMSVHPSSWAIGHWIADNLLYDAVARRVPRATRVRYEDVIADPRAELLQILAELELPATDRTLAFLDNASAELPVSHAIAGNPMRFQQGSVALRVDDEWRTSMSAPRRTLISAATWPLLRHYGYSLAPKAHPRP